MGNLCALRCCVRMRRGSFPLFSARKFWARLYVSARVRPCAPEWLRKLSNSLFSYFILAARSSGNPFIWHNKIEWEIFIIVYTVELSVRSELILRFSAKSIWIEWRRWRYARAVSLLVDATSHSSSKSGLVIEIDSLFSVTISWAVHKRWGDSKWRIPRHELQHIRIYGDFSSFRTHKKISATALSDFQWIVVNVCPWINGSRNTLLYPLPVFLHWQHQTHGIRIFVHNGTLARVCMWPWRDDDISHTIWNEWIRSEATRWA